MVDKLSIDTRKTVKLKYTCEDWDLYDTKPGCDFVARVLNDVFEESVNTGLNRRETEKRMHEVMKQYREFGTYDTEPGYVLDRLLDKVFGFY